MLDIKFIRENTDEVKKNCENRNVKCDIDRLLELDERRRDLIIKTDDLKAEKNQLNKELQSEEQDKKEVIERGKIVKEETEKFEKELERVLVEYRDLLLKVPNMASDDTPIGPDASGNIVIRKWGEIPKFEFKPKEHWQLAEELDLIDTPRAAKVSGARFNYLKGGLVLLEFALMQFAFSILTNEEKLKEIAIENNLTVSTKPFIPIFPPVMIRPDMMNRMARLDPEEMYILERDNLNLIGSAEHTLGAMYADEILDWKELPIRMVGFSNAFRREAGSYNKDMKGILRVHQFDKLEMESFTLPEDSLNEQNFIVAIQEYLVRQLKLSYQVVAICTGDMGRPDVRQIDIETWMPGQNKYRETNTSDLIGDFQSRRLNTRVRSENGTITYVHMNDATAFSQRPLVAIMENYQQADGSIVVPEVLRKYMPNNLSTIKL